MRVTSSSFYNSIYGDNNKLNRELFDVNKQISSGQKIQYAHENPEIFINTLKLDDEVTTLEQTKSSSQNALKFSSQTDTTIGEMVKTFESIKVKLINAANDSHSQTSLNAIAKELRGLENHLKTLANSSIGGKYLFSGTATTTPPLDANGNYQGNDQPLLSFLGSGIKQKYNITGQQLFLGNESTVNRSITSNVPQLSLTDLYPDVLKDNIYPRSAAEEKYITPSNTIRDLMGDIDNDPTNDTWQSHFYLQGTKSDGTSFRSKITLNMTDKVSDLLKDISDAYGADQVSVTLNSHGQIEIADLKNGSSKLDFHLVGATDFDAVGPDLADVTNTNALQSGTTNFEDIIAAPALNTLYVKEFTKSGTNQVIGAAVAGGTINPGDLVINGQDIGGVTFLANDSDNSLMDAINAKTPLTNVSATKENGVIVLNSLSAYPIVINGNIANQAATTLSTGLTFASYNTSGLDYDKMPFKKDGVFLTSNVPQVVSSDNSVANDSTLLGAVASGTTYDSANSRYNGLNGKVLRLNGTGLNNIPYDVNINLLDAGSTVTGTVNGVAVNFSIKDATDNNTDAGKMTYRQLMDVMNLIMTNSIPTGAPGDYNTKISNANPLAGVNLDKSGNIVFEDKVNPITSASISLYDATSGDFTTTNGSFLTFQANNAITVRDPKNNIFAQIDTLIRSVEEGKKHPDGNSEIDPRNLGVQNAIRMLDDMSDHISRVQSEAGSYSQIHDMTISRTELLIVSTKTLRSDVIDTDIAEASLQLQQLSLNYQALLANISKVSKLSLVNYL